MRKLYIYTGITPNQDNGRHFMFTNVSLYMAELQPHLLTVIDLDNSRINSNVATLALSSVLTEENFDTVTYLIDYDNESGYFRCYTVLRATLDNNIKYTLEVDLWATFIKDCDFSKVHVTRCNRQLNEYGIYDEPQSTERAMQSEIAEPVNKNWLVSGYNNALAKLDSVYVVILLQYNIWTHGSGDSKETATNTKLFAIPLNDASITLIKSENPSYNILDIATELIGGIYIAQGTGDPLDAKVLQAWLLPARLIYVTENAITLGSRFHTSPAQLRSLTAYYLRPEHSLTYLDFTVLPTDPNYVYYFGTINDGLKIKKYTKNTDRISCRVQCFTGTTTVRVLAMQGENQKDITASFEFTLTTNASVSTNIRQLATIFNTALNTGKSIFSDVKKADFASAGLTATGAFLSQLATPIIMDKAIGNGDGLTNFYINNPPVDSVRNPFVVTKFLSVNDADKHARMFGATFDYFADNGNAVTVFDFEEKGLLGNSSIVTDTYIVASCDIDGVPLEAHNEIGRKLTAGIYYKLLTE